MEILLSPSVPPLSEENGSISMPEPAAGIGTFGIFYRREGSRQDSACLARAHAAGSSPILRMLSGLGTYAVMRLDVIRLQCCGALDVGDILRRELK